MLNSNSESNYGTIDRLSELIERSYYDLQRNSNNSQQGQQQSLGLPTQLSNQQDHQYFNRHIGLDKQNSLSSSPQNNSVKMSISHSPQQSSANKYYRFVPKQSIPLYYDSGQWLQNTEKRESQTAVRAIDDDNKRQYKWQGWKSAEKPKQSLVSQEKKTNNDANQLFNQSSLLSKNQLQGSKIHYRAGLIIKQQKPKTQINTTLHSTQQYFKQKQELIQITDTFLYNNNYRQQPTSSSSQQTATTSIQSAWIPAAHYNIAPLSPNLSCNNHNNKPQPALTTTNHEDNCSHSQSSSFYDDDDNQNPNLPSLLRKQYEQDLFEFIKHQLMRVTVENKQTLQFEDDGELYYAAQKDRNRQLYSLYNKTKNDFIQAKQYFFPSLQSLQSQISILQQQLALSKAQRAKISTSITQKIHKQEKLYFRHKINLQNVILSNNQTLAYLSKQLQSVRRHQQQAALKSYSMLLQEQNTNLKNQLAQQQQLYNSTFAKFLAMDSALNHLRLQKQSQLNQLQQSLKQAKQLANYLIKNNH